jgi:hypothetical protein
MMQNNQTKDPDTCFEEDRNETEKGIHFEVFNKFCHN